MILLNKRIAQQVNECLGYSDHKMLGLVSKIINKKIPMTSQQLKDAKWLLDWDYRRMATRYRTNPEFASSFVLQYPRLAALTPDGSRCFDGPLWLKDESMLDARYASLPSKKRLVGGLVIASELVGAPILAIWKAIMFFARFFNIIQSQDTSDSNFLAILLQTFLVGAFLLLILDGKRLHHREREIADDTRTYNQAKMFFSKSRALEHAIVNRVNFEARCQEKAEKIRLEVQPVENGNEIENDNASANRLR
jgi:hypothetical protein